MTKMNQRNQLLLGALLAALSLNTSWWSSQNQEIESASIGSISIDNPDNPCGNVDSYYTEKDFHVQSCKIEKKFSDIRFNNNKKTKGFKIKKGKQNIQVQFRGRVAASTCRLKDGRQVVGFQIKTQESSQSKLENFNGHKKHSFFVPAHKVGAKKECQSGLNQETITEKVSDVLDSHFKKRTQHFKNELKKASVKKKNKIKNRYASCLNKNNEDDFEDFDPILGDLKQTNAMTSVAREIQCRNEIVSESETPKAQKLVQQRCVNALHLAQDLTLQGEYEQASTLAAACENELSNNAVACERATYQGLHQALSTPHYMRNQPGYDFTGLRHQATLLERSDSHGQTPGSRFEAQNLRTFIGDYSLLASQQINAAHNQRVMQGLSNGQRARRCSLDSQKRIQLLTSKISNIAQKQFQTALKTPAVVDPNRYLQGQGVQNQVYCNPFLTQDRNQKNCTQHQTNTRRVARRTNRSLGNPVQFQSATPVVNHNNTIRRAVRVLQ